jgi:hypothetical protein
MTLLILTQPLANNYGGILQAYALQTVLKRMGHSVVTDAKPYRYTTPLLCAAKVAQAIIFRYILKKEVDSASVFFPFHIPKIRQTIFRYTLRFVKEHISTIDFRPSRKAAKPFDAIIVGSDQVWRRCYSNVPLHMLDFTRGMHIKRITYAASFGTEDLSEYPKKLIKRTAKLAQLFDAISVREDSAVQICKKYWNRDAIHLLDPTLLLDPDDYRQLLQRDSQVPHPSPGNLFVYILDRSPKKQQIISHVASSLHLSPFEVFPEDARFPTLPKDLEKHTYPPVSQWLQGFIDAQFIVTDSFHGTLFSILFNKPFLTIGNPGRGMARFSSILKTFQLENRLVNTFDPCQLNQILASPIPWNPINQTLAQKREESFRFLNQHLPPPL